MIIVVANYIYKYMYVPTVSKVPINNYFYTSNLLLRLVFQFNYSPLTRLQFTLPNLLIKNPCDGYRDIPITTLNITHLIFLLQLNHSPLTELEFLNQILGSVQ